MYFDLNPAEIREWIKKLPMDEKNDLLVRLIVEKEGGIAIELIQRLRREGEGDLDEKAATPRRTARELLREAEKIAEERQRIQKEKAAKEKEQRSLMMNKRSSTLALPITRN